MLRLFALLTLLVIGLTSCATQPPEVCPIPTIAPPLNDLNQDPYFRAGTIQTWSNKSYGVSFLFKKDNTLMLGTIKHVARLSETDCTYIAIRGTSLHGTVIWTKFQFQGDYDDRYKLATYPLSESFKNDLQTQINSKVIEPLSISSQSISIGDTIAIPMSETGDYTIYVVTGKENNLWVAQSDGSQGIICRGRSGGPVLRIEKQEVTHEVIGVVSAISDLEGYKSKDQSGNDCSLMFYFTPIE